MDRKESILDLTGCKYILDLHKRIKESLKFPDYYGMNWDAFWDCINRDFEGEKVIVKGVSTVAEELKPSIKVLNEILEQNKQYWIDSNCPFDYELID